MWRNGLVELSLTMTQLRAIEILLRKSIPDQRDEVAPFQLIECADNVIE